MPRKRWWRKPLAHDGGRADGALCRPSVSADAHTKYTIDGVNDPGVLARGWPQAALAGSFTPSLVRSWIATVGGLIRGHNVRRKRVSYGASIVQGNRP
ncbi:MAG TPA: hypothetical protein PKW63_12260 [Vicinamibacterales bacterium]|nr:hypothetical protein [Vicinamibacterales bacterium]HQZ40967.1 hypothetical protein [Vicinamibacterales bacterium]